MIIQIGKIQRYVLMHIGDALRSTPSEALNAVLQILPLDLVVYQSAAITALRLRKRQINGSGSHGDTRKYWLNTTLYRVVQMEVVQLC